VRKTVLSRTARKALVFFALTGCTLLVHANPVPDPVIRALTQEKISMESVAVRVQRLSGIPTVHDSQVEMAFQDERLMNPASVMKLATAYAALKALGPTYTWRTEIAFSAWPENGRLPGSLYLVGFGDPVLSHERLYTLLRQVRALGVSHIEGDFVLDDTAWTLPPFDPGAFDEQPMRPYNVGASALLMNFNAVRLSFVPHPQKNSLHTLPEPRLSGLESTGQMPVLSSGECGRFQRELKPRLELREGKTRLHVEGPYPRSCGYREFHLAPWPITQFNQALIHNLWAEVGGTIKGTVRYGKTPPDALTALSVNSPPLADVIRDMNKWSNNVLARQILATLGAQANASEVKGGGDTLRQGALALIQTLDAAGLPTEGMHVENGAGLSRDERLSARQLTALLKAAFESDVMPEFLAALPVVGVDGTARRRLKDSPARAQARIKTGTLNEVSAMAGYVRDKKGDWWAIAMLVNHPKAQASQAAQDALIEWIFDQ
jgi:serine-type D-Ala-D-Ala carboxypeptidase/endopeptidase (penicillin-binding protein 4)